MFTVYISRFQSGSTFVSTEQEMFSVPTTTELPVQHPVIKSSEDAADNFSFTMEANSPYYDALLPLKTMIRVTYGRDYTPPTIFYGRVLSIATSTAYQTKNVTCEGWYAFLNDSFYEGTPEKNREDITIDTYFTKLINNHNLNVPDKQVYRGNVDFTLPSDTYKYEPASWTQTSSLISNLASNHGGHMKIRYNGNMTPYLDWYKYYATDLGDGLRPQVKIGRNILDISSDQNPDDIFTRLIPIGDSGKDGTPIYIDGVTYTDRDGVSHMHSGKKMPVSLIPTLYSDVALSDDFHTPSDYTNAESTYGVIYKTMTFSDADSKEKLWNLAKDWIKNSYFGLASSFSVKAVDMHIINSTYQKILLGDCVDLTYLITRNGTPVWETKKLVCKSVQYDLFDPDNNTYVFGIPTDVLEHNRNNKKSSKGNTASEAAAPKGFGGGGGSDAPETFESIYMMIGKRNGNQDYEGTAAATSFWNNGPMSGTVTCFDPAETTDPMNHKDLWFKASVVGKITLSGRSTKYIAVSSERGIFAYTNTGVLNHDYPYMVTYWYVKKKGIKFDGDAAVVSTFDKIAEMIEADSSSYGGSAKAEYFRNYKEVKGTFKCFDPEMVDETTPTADASKIFNAQIVGKIAPTTYVGISGEYGIFACSPYRGAGAYRGICQVVHWYSKAKGVTYDSSPGEGGVFTDSNGDLIATADGYLDGDKTIWMKPTQLTGQGSEGQILVGYDLTAAGDQWRIGLNVPIQYTDESGQTQIADGFVSAHDFAIGEIPSFKTKLAVIDVAIVGVLQAQEVFADRLTADEASISNLRSTKITAEQMFTELASADTVTVKTISSNRGSAIFYTVSATNVFKVGDVDCSFLPNGVRNVQVVPVANTNEYVLQYRTYADPSSWTDAGTFSRATSLSGGWSGSGEYFTYTVEASPQGATKAGKVLIPNEENTETSFIWIRLYDDASDTAASISRQYTVSVDEDYAYIKWGNTIVARTPNSGSGEVVTLTGEYGGDNTGITATYTVTASDPMVSPSTGTFTLHLNANAAYLQDPEGTIRARVANTWGTVTTTGAWSGSTDTFNYTVNVSPHSVSKVGKAVLPNTENTSTNYMWVRLYDDVSDSAASISRQYTVSVDDDYAYIKWGNTIVAQTPNTGGGETVTLTGAYGGDNTGNTATYTVTASDPDVTPVTGSFTLHVAAAAAYLTDGGTSAIRARVANPWGTVTTTGAWSGSGDTYTYTVAVSPHSVSKAGKAVLPNSENTSTNYMWVRLYDDSSDSSASISRQYTVSVDANYAYIKYGTTTVARTSAETAYNAGWTAFNNSGDWERPAASSTAAAAVVKIPGTTPSGAQRSWFYITSGSTITYDSATHTYTAVGQAKIGSDIIAQQSSGTESGTEAYVAGWSDYWNSGDWERPTLDNGGTVKIPGSTPTEGQRAWFILSAGSSIEYDSSTHKYKATGTAKIGSSTVAEQSTATESGLEAYNAGWTAYWNSGNWGRPGASTAAAAVVKIPGQTPTSAQTSWFYIGAGSTISYDPSTHKYTATGQAKIGTTVIAQQAAGSLTVSGTEAYDAVTITAVTRSGATVTATASNGNTGTLTLTEHTNCIAGATRYGTQAIPILYIPDSGGITITTKVKNISQAGRWWYYRSANQTPTTYYT